MSSKSPPLNKFFKTKTCWFSYSTDGDSTKHKEEPLIVIQYEKDQYAFMHSGQAYLHERIGPIKEWELLC
jgi:hypothetical protein